MAPILSLRQCGARSLAPPPPVHGPRLKELRFSGFLGASSPVLASQPPILTESTSAGAWDAPTGVFSPPHKHSSETGTPRYVPSLALALSQQHPHADLVLKSVQTRCEGRVRSERP